MRMKGNTVVTNEVQAAGGVVVNKDGLVAIVSNRGVSWSLPKGKIDPGESPVEAAQREVYEETGIKKMSVIRELGVYSRYRNAPDGTEDRTELKTLHIFLIKADKKKLTPVDAHNPEAKWIEKEKVCDYLTHPKDREFFQSIIDLI